MRRGLLIALAALLVVAGILGILAFFTARDDSTIGEDAAAPGQEAPDATARVLEQGNVIFLYAEPADREPLEELAAEIAGPSDEALRHAGQAIIVEKGDGLGALAYERRVEVSSPDDPELQRFAEYWLGRGAMR